MILCTSASFVCRNSPVTSTTQLEETRLMPLHHRITWRSTTKHLPVALLTIVLVFASLVPATSASPLTVQHPAGLMALNPPDVTAKSVYVYDATSGIELYTKNANEHLQVGSIVKIATALVVVNNAGLDEQVVIQESDLVDTQMYSNMALVAGDTLTVSQLLYGLLIPSGNDGARALARHVGAKLSGSEDARVATAAFVQEMNAYAASIGLTDSRFTVPDGIDTPNSYSTAHDVAILSGELMKNEFLRGVVINPAYRFTSVGPEQRVYEKSTTNERLGVSGVVGIKTGTTQQAGGNVVLGREVNGGSNLVIIAIIGADHSYITGDPASDNSRWSDADAIMAAMDAQFTWSTPDTDGVLAGLSEEMQVWNVQMQNPPTIPVPTTGDVALGYQLQIGAATNPGERAGTLHLYYGENQVGTIPIFQAGQSAARIPFSRNAA